MTVKLRAGTRVRQSPCRIRSMCGAMSAEWNPGDLAGLAATIVVAEQRSAGLLWQNTAKTIAATADGDPVRVAVCPYTAVEFTAPSDAARPLLYDEGSGKWSLSFDGVDDQLRTTTSPAYAQPCAVATVHRTDGVAFKYLYSSLADFGVAMYRGNGGGGSASWSPYAGSSAAAYAAAAAGAVRRLTTVYSGAITQRYVDGVANGAPSDAGANNGSGLVIGNRFDNALPCDARVVALLAWPNPTAEQIALLDAFLLTYTP